MTLCSLCNEAAHPIEQCWVKIKIDRLCPTEKIKIEALEAWRCIIEHEIENNQGPTDTTKVRKKLFKLLR